MKMVMGDTLLIQATRAGELGSVKGLLDKNADVNGASDNGWTALMWACNMYGQTHYEVYQRIARLLVEKGADLKVRDKNGKTPLIVATQVADLPTTNLLLDRGADASVKEKSGYTPLLYTLTERWKDADAAAVVPRLVKAGANVSEQSPTKQTPIQLAQSLHMTKTLASLRAAGAR